MVCFRISRWRLPKVTGCISWLPALRDWWSLGEVITGCRTLGETVGHPGHRWSTLWMAGRQDTMVEQFFPMYLFQCFRFLFALKHNICNFNERYDTQWNMCGLCPCACCRSYIDLLQRVKELCRYLPGLEGDTRSRCCSQIVICAALVLFRSAFLYVSAVQPALFHGELLLPLFFLLDFFFC